MGSLSLLQWIFPTRGLSWYLLHCRQILYQMSYRGSSKIFVSIYLQVHTLGDDTHHFQCVLEKKIYLFTFVYAGSSLQCRLFSSCREWGLLPSCNVLASLCSGFSCGAQTLGHMGSAVVAPEFWSSDSIVVAHGLSCSEVYGIFLNQGSNPRLLHWQVDSLQLSH